MNARRPANDDRIDAIEADNARAMVLATAILIFGLGFLAGSLATAALALVWSRFL